MGHSVTLISQGVQALLDVKQLHDGQSEPFSGFKRQYFENGRRYVQSYY